MAPSDTPATFETFRAELARLVAQFDRQHPTYTAPDYNEQTLRADFLDTFFRALGWDVGNQKGLIHTEREVDIEVRTHMSGRQTRADYVFRLNRTERFTCEAKKPAEALHDRHIFQAKRDAFARGVPLALLSDFEETKIFIVGARPHLDDPHTGEWKILNFRQYNDAARELWDLLAYDSVKAGSIDQLIDSLPKRPLRLKGRQGYLIKPDRTRSLDADFLNFLDGVRQQLGSDLLKHNDRADLLEGHRLNEAAQRIIDRLVFLRICEDRGIDTGALLQTLFDGWYRQQPDAAKPRLRKPGKQSHLRFGGALEEEPPAAGYGARGRTEGTLYRELTEHIRALDQRPPSYKPFFNGQLFKPHFSEELVVGDEWLSNFLLDLVDDGGGYNFADIKVEILGDAYERFLGKILVPRGTGAGLLEKPEVRKAGGVYYTPRYITDYIVEQTVGRLLEGKTPKQVEKLKIVDPACGSGSFLLRAYSEVMDHHLRWFTANPDKRRKEDCYVDAANNVRLTTTLKRRILENNIHGVDIDAQAVEVTQLSLYLKMLEGENRETLRAQVELFKKEPLLPPLDDNIKCFNSLIASDFSLDPAELVRVNAGDWDVHFAQIMKSGGFDAVIGNPPYVQIENIPTDSRTYFVETYGENGKLGKRYDLYQVFVLRGIKLLRIGGLFGNILPNTFLMGHSYSLLRKRLIENGAIPELVDLPQGVFHGVTIDNVLLFFERQESAKSRRSHQIQVNKLLPKSEKSRVSKKDWDESFPIKQSELNETSEWKINVHTNPQQALLFVNIERSGKCLGDETESSQGIILYRTEKEAEADKYTSREERKGWKRLLRGKNIARYETLWGGEFVSYGDWLWCAREERFFNQPKILLHAMRNKALARRLVATLDSANFYNAHNLANIVAKEHSPFALKFILGIFNSALINYWYRSHFPNVNINPSDFREIPLPKIDFRISSDKASHDRLVALVDKMLTLTPALRTAKSAAEKTTLQNALTKTDREIDQLVYQLYGLTPEEIALVEGTGNPAS